MAQLIVLLSGRICTGKSTLAENLARDYRFAHVSTRGFLRARKLELPPERLALQDFGEQLDLETEGVWVRDDLEPVLQGLDSEAFVVVDSVRAKCQVKRLREAYRSRVVHVHLDCSDEELARRYSERKDGQVIELDSFSETQKNKTEAAVRELKDEADICILTDRCSKPDVLIRVACYLRLHGRGYQPHVDVVVGGQYGSEGKGQVAAFLAREYDLLVRVGGPNAGHKVWEPGKPYTFHLLPSGTRCSEAKLLLGPGTAINLDTLRREISQCEVEYGRLFIDPRAIIITDDDIAREKAGLKDTIGSTASGTGYAMIRRIARAKDTLFAEGVPELKPFIRPALDVLEETRIAGRKVLFEGTQGTGLSLFHGNYPHVTSRDTTVSGCLAEAGIPPRCVRRVIMVCRTYPIRVQSPEGGDSGPMSAELKLADIHERSGVDLEDLERTEITSTTGRKRRMAEFDWVQLRRSAALNAPTDIALTFADYLDAKNRDARRFDQLTSDTIHFIADVERVTSTPVSLISTRFHARAIIDRRHW